MINRMLGAPLGGTTSPGQYGFDWAALVSISPRNCCGGGGKYLPSMVVVAPGDPDVTLVCWALAGAAQNSAKAAQASKGSGDRSLSIATS
jgi:hypothetical protein